MNAKDRETLWIWVFIFVCASQYVMGSWLAYN